MGEWISIDESPRDGSPFLAVNEAGFYAVCQWIFGELVVAWDHSRFGIAEYFMYLPAVPAPPTAADDQEVR